MLREGRERLEIAFGIGGQNEELHTEPRRRLSHVTRLGFGTGIVWIEKGRHAGGFRNNLVQQSQPLRLEPPGQLINSGHIAARPVEAGDEAEIDWVAAN